MTPTPRRDSRVHAALHRRARDVRAAAPIALALDAPPLAGCAPASGNARYVPPGARRGDRVKLLVLAPNWLGDAIMALPAIADLRRHYPDATLTLAARRPLAAPPDDPGVDGACRSMARRRKFIARCATTSTGCGRALRCLILLPNPSCRPAAYAARIPALGISCGNADPLLTRAIPNRGCAPAPGRYYQHLKRALGIASGPQLRGAGDGQAARVRPHVARTRVGRETWSASRPARPRVASLVPSGWQRLPNDGAASGVRGGWGAAATRDGRHCRAAGAPAPARDRSRSGRKTDMRRWRPCFALPLHRLERSGRAPWRAGDVPSSPFLVRAEWSTSPLPGPVRSIGDRHMCILPACCCGPSIDHRCMTGIAVEDVMTPALAALNRPPVRTEAP